MMTILRENRYIGSRLWRIQWNQNAGLLRVDAGSDQFLRASVPQCYAERNDRDDDDHGHPEKKRDPLVHLIARIFCLIVCALHGLSERYRPNDKETSS